jgi:hypothetical protein
MTATIARPVETLQAGQASLKELADRLTQHNATLAAIGERLNERLEGVDESPGKAVAELARSAQEQSQRLNERVVEIDRSLAEAIDRLHPALDSLGNSAVDVLRQADAQLAIGGAAPGIVQACVKEGALTQPWIPRRGPDEALYWARSSPGECRPLKVHAARQSHDRHKGKYAAGDVGEAHSFYLRTKTGSASAARGTSLSSWHSSTPSQRTFGNDTCVPAISPPGSSM